MNKIENSLSLVAPGQEQYFNWKLNIELKSGLNFDIHVIKLAVINLIESWTYLDLEQSLDRFKNYKGEWLIELDEQMSNELLNECLTLIITTHE